MEAIILYLRDLNLVSAIIRLLLSMLVGGVLGLERGKQGRAAGMRTHTLVCLGSTLVAMMGIFTISELGFTGDPLRVAAQVVSGIGFLGVGTILIKGRFQITGLTTAAGLWCTAAIGLALGAGYYEAALITFLLCVLTVTVVHRLEYTINRKYTRFGIYVEIRSDADVRRTISYMQENFRVSDIQVTSPRSSTPGNVGIEANIYNPDFMTNPDKVSSMLEEQSWVAFALESI